MFYLLSALSFACESKVQTVRITQDKREGIIGW